MPHNFSKTQGLPGGPEPAFVGTKELLIERALARLRSIPDPLCKYTMLAALRARNPDVFYGLVGGNLQETTVRPRPYMRERLRGSRDSPGVAQPARFSLGLLMWGRTTEMTDGACAGHARQSRRQLRNGRRVHRKCAVRAGETIWAMSSGSPVVTLLSS